MVAKLEGGLGKPVPTTNCRACYEYERREGCWRCATPFRAIFSFFFSA
jgi:hypothetical protein